MSFLIIPNEVHADRAVVWIGAVDEGRDPAGVSLEYGTARIEIGGWTNHETRSGEHRIAYRRLELTGLAPRRTYRLRLVSGGREVADGSVTTLPERLPRAGEKPFTVLLGSCFYRPEDKVGAVGRAYTQLPAQQRPDIKILCGDQVYLDAPWYHFLIPRGAEWLEDRSFNWYADSWGQAVYEGGFGRLLKHGANYFTSDDHEFWNNAPDRGLNVLISSWTEGQRDRWFGIARALYEIFQTERSFTTFAVGQLSFCLLDTRVNRRKGRAALVLPEDLRRLEAWLDSLSGPGVLVLGQPLLDDEGGIKDYTLRDYPEYKRITDALRRSAHWIVLLTGDVHFGRIASCPLRRDLGTRLVEIISSPMQLVPKAKGKFAPAPYAFAPAETGANFWADEMNHFMTLEFSAASDARVRMAAKYWPINPAGTRPHPAAVSVAPGGDPELW